MSVLLYLQSKVKTEDYGKHLQATENLLQQHTLHDAQLQALTKRVQVLNRKSTQIAEEGHPEAKHLNNKLEALNKELQRYVVNVNDMVCIFITFVK